jgi:hypothetical protein
MEVGGVLFFVGTIAAAAMSRKGGESDVGLRIVKSADSKKILNDDPEKLQGGRGGRAGSPGIFEG